MNTCRSNQLRWSRLMCLTNEQELATSEAGCSYRSVQGPASLVAIDVLNE
jgi:hypothetical protein